MFRRKGKTRKVFDGSYLSVDIPGDEPVWTMTNMEDELTHRPLLNEVNFLGSRSWKDLEMDPNAPKTTGRFTSAEDDILRYSLERYFGTLGESWSEGIHKLIFSKLVPSPWPIIASALPRRNIESVILRVQSVIYQWPRKGKWTDEENLQLLELINLHGTDWKGISLEMHRYWKLIRDHYEDLVQSGKAAKYEKNPNEKIATPLHYRLWTDEEERDLLEALKIATGVSYPWRNIPWERVRELFGPHRGRTRASLRHHYICFLLPNQCGLPSTHFVCTRIAVGYLYDITNKFPHVHWQEIKWTNCLPHWPRLKVRYLAKRAILAHVEASRNIRLTKKGVDKLFDSSRWVKIVQELNEVLACHESRYDDGQVIEQYYAILCKYNGFDSEAPRKQTTVGAFIQPYDTLEEKTRNIARRKLTSLRTLNYAEQPVIELTEGNFDDSLLDYLTGSVQNEIDNVSVEIPEN